METCKQRQFKIIVEKHADGYVAYPLGLKGVVVGDDTYDEAVADVKSAIRRREAYQAAPQGSTVSTK